MAQLFPGFNSVQIPTLYPSNNSSVMPVVGTNYQPTNIPHQLTQVNGIESAKAYPTSPNSMYALFDSNEDVFYVKTTDASNFPVIKKYRFYEETEPIKEEASQYVTVEEFEKFKKEILDAKQFVSKQSKSDKYSHDSGRKSDVNGQG